MALFRYKCEELLRVIPDLQCRKCKDVPGPSDDQKNRYFCTNIKESHALCYNHNAECPCGALVGENPSPVIAKLLKNLPWMCQNYKNGCREIMADVEELEHHQQKCIFRKVYCPYCMRQFKMFIFKDVINHVNIAHKYVGDYKITEEGAKMMITKSKLKDFYFKLGYGKITSIDRNVFYHVIDGNVGAYYFWIYFLGSADAAKNFSCTYSVKNKNGETFTYTGSVNTLDRNKADIFASGSCFTMLEKAFYRSWEGEICITIRNLKEEAKDDNEESGISDGE